MALGSIASMAGTFVTHPVDTVRSVVTVGGAAASRTMREVTREIIEREGLLGLYRGLGPNMVITHDLKSSCHRGDWWIFSP